MHLRNAMRVSAGEAGSRQLPAPRLRNTKSSRLFPRPTPKSHPHPPFFCVFLLNHFLSKATQLPPPPHLSQNTEVLSGFFIGKTHRREKTETLTWEKTRVESQGGGAPAAEGAGRSRRPMGEGEEPMETEEAAAGAPARGRCCGRLGGAPRATATGTLGDGQRGGGWAFPACACDLGSGCWFLGSSGRFCHCAGPAGPGGAPGGRAGAARPGNS